MPSSPTPLVSPSNSRGIGQAQGQAQGQFSDDDVNINIDMGGQSQGQTGNMGQQQTATGGSGGSAEENGGQEKIEICHNGQTLEVAASALPAHYGHGDTLGPCPEVVPEIKPVSKTEKKKG